MKKYLISGCSGTVGTAVGLSLLHARHEVVGVDLNPNPHSEALDKRTLKMDLCDKDAVLENLAGDYDAILHFGAHARVPHSVQNPSLARDNILSTFNLLELARQTPDTPFIFASSKDVYGNHVSTLEGAVHVDYCESPYGASKIASEALIFAYNKSYGLDFTILRLSNVYGRYSEDDRVLPIFIRMTQQNKDITVKGADKLLDFVHVEDVVDAVQLVLDQFPKARNQVFNLASGEGISLLTMAELIKQKLGGRNKIKVADSEAGEVVQSVSKISKIREVLGFEPKIDFETGIQTEISQHTRTIA